MKKINMESSWDTVNEYVEELKKSLPGYDVNFRNANDFQKMLDEKSNCKKCKGLEFCSNEARGCCYLFKDNQFSFVECKYKKEERTVNQKQSLIKTLYLPAKILEASIENYDLTSESRKKIYSETMDFINNYKEGTKRKGLYLHGTFSIGKTYTLACIANELARNDVSCLLIYFPDLVSDLKNALGTPRFETVINMLKSIDVLMLDDLGSENMTPWIRDEVLGPVLNYRVLEGKSLFISSNIAPNKLKEHFAIDKAPQSVLKADRIISRMNALLTSVSMEDGEKYKR